MVQNKKNAEKSAGMFQVHSKKFKLQYNETILSLQYYKLIREQKENVEEWIGHLKTKSQ